MARAVAGAAGAAHVLMMGVARLFLLLAILLPFPASAAEDLPAAMDPPPPRPRIAAKAEASLPADEAACRQRLGALGAVFTEAAPIDEDAGCAAAHPLTLSQLSATIALQPPAVLTCAMAEASARFVRDHAAPLAERLFRSRLAGIEQASSYVCRPRHGTQKLSEHAFANALDWSALVLADGTRIEVRARDAGREPRRFALLSGIRKAACGPFATVLGPGSDADHADHFHFDLAKRRNPFCQ